MKKNKKEVLITSKILPLLFYEYKKVNIFTERIHFLCNLTIPYLSINYAGAHYCTITIIATRSPTLINVYICHPDLTKIVVFMPCPAYLRAGSSRSQYLNFKTYIAIFER